MTTRDYVKLAEALRLTSLESYKTPCDCETLVAHAIRNVADVLAADNPRFDRVKFYAASLGEIKLG